MRCVWGVDGLDKDNKQSTSKKRSVSPLSEDSIAPQTSIDLLLTMHNVVRVIIRSWRLHEGRTDVAGERICRMEWIVAVGLRWTVAYHGSFTVLMQMILGRLLHVSIPIVGDASISGRLFLKKKFNSVIGGF